MGRQPADILAASRDPVSRDALWGFVRPKGDAWFTIGDLYLDTFMPRRTISSYLHALLAGGFVERNDAVSPHRWRLVGSPPKLAPRLRPDGTPVPEGSGTENMWRTMRMMPQFSPRDIAAHASTDAIQVTELTASSYCGMLHRTGFLRVIRASIPKRRQAVYRLIRNTGPKPPQIQRVKQVFDPNTGQVHLQGGAYEHRS